MPDWHEIVIRDATHEPDVEQHTLRSAALEEHLAGEGWTPLGVLVEDATVFLKDAHPLIRAQYLPVWRAPDGGTVATVQRMYGVDTMELQSLFEDGTVLRTRWSSRPGGVPGAWFAYDPRHPAPEKLQKEKATPAHAASSLGSARYWTRASGAARVEHALGDHEWWVKQTRDASGRRVGLDVHTMGAIFRRGNAIALSKFSKARFAASALPPLVVLVGLVWMLVNPLAAQPPPSLSLDAPPPPESLGWTPILATGVGALLGAAVAQLGPRLTLVVLGSLSALAGFFARRAEGGVFSLLFLAVPFLLGSGGLAFAWAHLALPRLEQLLFPGTTHFTGPMHPQQLLEVFGAARDETNAPAA